MLLQELQAYILLGCLDDDQIIPHLVEILFVARTRAETMPSSVNQNVVIPAYCGTHGAFCCLGFFLLVFDFHSVLLG